MTDFYNDGADYVFMSILGVSNSVIGFLSYLLCNGKKNMIFKKKRFDKEASQLQSRNQAFALDYANIYNNHNDFFHR